MFLCLRPFCSQELLLCSSLAGRNTKWGRKACGLSPGDLAGIICADVIIVDPTTPSSVEHGLEG